MKHYLKLGRKFFRQQTIAVILATILSFSFTFTLGKKYVAKKLAQKWEAIDVEIHKGGLFYSFAVHSLPIITSGIINLTVELTSIIFQYYLIGTILENIP